MATVALITAQEQMEATMKRLIGVFVLSAVFVGIVVYSAETRAFFARQEASYCQVQSGGNDNFSNGCNFNTSFSMVVSCGVEDTAVNPKNTITTFNVHVSSRSSSSSLATRCVNFWNAPGTSCGSSFFGSGIGMLVLQPPTFAGWTAADFGFVQVIMPPSTSSG